MNTSYRNGIRLRCIVTAWREEEVEGDVERVISSVDRCVYVEVDTFPAETQTKRAKEMALTIIRAGIDAGKPVDMLLKDAKVWGPRAVPVKKALQRLTTASLEAALQHAGKIDRLAKGIGQGNIWEEFLRLGLRLTTVK